MRAPLDSSGSLIWSSWWCLSSETDQIHFTAVENHAYVVEKDALNSLLLFAHDTSSTPPVRALAGILRVTP